MAIVVKEQREEHFNLFPLIVGVFFLIVIGGAVYFLFLAPTPFIEKISPTTIENVSDLTAGTDDPSEILNNPIYTSLSQHVPNPDVGQLGRPNPFAQF